MGANKQRRPVCEALPNGIPKAIFMDEADHFKENYPGDNGMLGIPKEN